MVRRDEEAIVSGQQNSDSQAGVIPSPTMSQIRRNREALPDPVKRIPATIWKGVDPSLRHLDAWNVEISAPGWGDDHEFETPGFATCDEAYEYIHTWAAGRGVVCVVTFGLLAGVDL